MLVTLQIRPSDSCQARAALVMAAHLDAMGTACISVVSAPQRRNLARSGQKQWLAYRTFLCRNVVPGSATSLTTRLWRKGVV